MTILSKEGLELRYGNTFDKVIYFDVKNVDNYIISNKDRYIITYTQD